MASTPVPSIEIGSLTAASPDESQFIGSSSGVFFVNTVHRAFARSKKGGIPDRDVGGSSISRNAASVENFIVGNDSPPRSQSIDETGRRFGRNPQGIQALGIHSRVLGKLPSQECAKALIMAYFQTWHPLFPFVHGPTFLLDLESFYSKTNNFQNQMDRLQICRTIMFQCVFNIAALDRPDLAFPEASQIESSSSLLSLLGIVATKHDTIALQSLLSAQLYLIATMSLRAASTVGGILVKLLFHGGFHRCPFRYDQLSQHDCEIRKRIFWSAYATERYLSQALGHPLGIQDSDIDVCVQGTEELHQPVPQGANSHSLIDHSSGAVRAHLPQGHPDLVRAPSGSEDHAQEDGNNQSGQNSPREDILANYISYCRITGRALELFHKSVHARSVEHRSIILLTSDVHSWWNNLPEHLQEWTSSGDAPSFSSFFNILYQNLIILINRPFLSLNPSSPEFRLSLQTCVAASRKLILILRDHASVFSWPGILSGTWMAGLVLAFACELDQYPFAKGISEIEICLSLLQRMSNRFSTARHSHAVLSILLNDLHTQIGKDEGARRQTSSGINDNPQKKRRLHTQSSISSNSPKSPSTSQFPSASQFRSTGTSSTPRTISANETTFAMTSNQSLQSSSDSQRQGPSPIMPWSDPMMSGGTYPDVGDVFGQISWEALFQSDSMGWDEWGVPGV